MRKVNQEIRRALKRAFGPIVDSGEAKKRSIAVGDVSSYNLIKEGKEPILIIRDSKIKRKDAEKKVVEELDKYGRWVFLVENPRGCITDEAEEAVRMIIEEKAFPARVDVDGEEDLLALIAMKYAKEGQYIYYGQPDFGLVEVKIDENIKRDVNKILAWMEEIK